MKREIFLSFCLAGYILLVVLCCLSTTGYFTEKHSLAFAKKAYPECTSHKVLSHVQLTSDSDGGGWYHHNETEIEMFCCVKQFTSSNASICQRKVKTIQVQCTPSCNLL